MWKKKMLACIACVNKEEGGGRDRDREDGGARSGGGDTPSCRDPVKSLTSQVHSSIISPPLLFLFFINSLAGYCCVLRRRLLHPQGRS